jgi:hypothetical protein
MNTETNKRLNQSEISQETNQLKSTCSTSDGDKSENLKNDQQSESGVPSSSSSFELLFDREWSDCAM